MLYKYSYIIINMQSISSHMWYLKTVIFSQKTKILKKTFVLTIQLKKMKQKHKQQEIIKFVLL